MPESRSRHMDGKGRSGGDHGRRPNNGGDAAVMELRSKKVHGGGHNEAKDVMPRRKIAKGDNVHGKGKGVGGSKGKSVDMEGEVGEKEGEGTVNVVLRHRCSLKAVCGLNSELMDFQKAAVEGTKWSPVLKYKPFVMDRHLVRTLVESWNPEMKTFKIGRTEVPFSVYDVALLTGLPATGKEVTFVQGEGVCEVEEVVKGAMEERLMRERTRRRIGQTDTRMYRNYVYVMVDLCEQNNTPERLGMFTKLYSLLVISWLLFPHTTGGVTWELTEMNKDVNAMAEYNWSQAVWSFLVEAIEETKDKI